MSFFENWSDLNNKIKFENCSLFFNSQRRFFAENSYNDLSYKFIFRRTISLLFSSDMRSKTSKIMFYYGGLQFKINAGVLMDKISTSINLYDYEIIHEDFLKINEKRRLGRFSLIAISLFVSNAILFLSDFIKNRKHLRLSTRQFLSYFLYKNALISSVYTSINRNNIVAFITYNDYLGISADICAAFRFSKKAVFHVQHGVISEVNYPGLSTHYILWGENSKKKCIEYGYNESILHIKGSACFSKTKTSVTKNNNKLLFFSQTNQPEHTGIIYCEEVKKWLITFAKQHIDWTIIIRLHPSEYSNSFYSDISIPSNIVFQNSNDCSINQAIKNATICSTIWSGAGIDAMVMQKPLLVFSPLGFIQKTNWVKDGCVEIKTFEEFDSFVCGIDNAIIQNILQVQKMVLAKEIANVEGAEKIAQFIDEETKKQNINSMYRYINDIEKLKKRLFIENIITDASLTVLSHPFIGKHPGSTFKIGKNCTILNNTAENVAGITRPSSIYTMSEKAELTIGDYVGMSGTAICCVFKITIGNYVNFGAGTRVYDSDWHPIDYLERRKNPGIDLDKIPYAAVSIGDDVWTGADVIILKGVTLGKRVIVAAGSVVTKSFPDDVIIGGNPARVLKHLKP